MSQSVILITDEDTTLSDLADRLEPTPELCRYAEPREEIQIRIESKGVCVTIWEIAYREAEFAESWR